MDRMKGSRLITRRSFLGGATLFGASSLVAGSLLAACGAAPEPTATPAPAAKPAATTAPAAAPTTAPSAAATPAAKPAASTEKFTIRISGSSGATTVARGDIGKEYMKDHPNVTVEYEPLADVLQKQQVMVAGGTAGEAYQGWSVDQYKMMLIAGVYADHTDLIKSHNYDFGALLKQAQDGVTSQGKIWGIPYEDHAGYAHVFINKTMFDKAGVPIPKLDWTSETHPGLTNWTFDDVRKAAIALTKREGGKTTQWGFQLIGAANTFAFLWCAIRSMGGNYLSSDGSKAQLDTPEARDTIKWYVDMHQKDKVAPLSADNPSGGPNLFATGRIGIRLAATHQVVDMKQQVKDFEWMALPGPRGKGGNDGLFEFNSWHVLKTAKHPDETFEVIKVMTTPEASRKIRQMGGNNGSWKALWEDPGIAGDPIFSVMAKTVMASSGLLVAGNGRCIELGDTARQLLNPLWNGERTDVDQAITEINTKLQAILDKPPAAISSG